MPNSFINMIRLLFQDVAISVNINNQASKPFGIHRRVHQGCHLAPDMFIIVGEALNATVKNAVKIGLIKGIFFPQCTTQQIISQYIDDTSFTVRAEDNIDNLVGIFHNFGLAFGMEINQPLNILSLKPFSRIWFFLRNGLP